MHLLLFVLLQMACLCHARDFSFVDEQNFASTHDLEAMTSKVGMLGLHTTASPRQELLIDYVTEELSEMSSLQLDFHTFDLPTWHTRGDKTLREAGKLLIETEDGVSQGLQVAGAIPYSASTLGWSSPSSIIYVPRDVKINATDVEGKVVLRDFGPTTSIPFKIAFAPGYYRTPDTNALLNTSYDRPYTFTPDQDLADATTGGATALISMFNVSDQFVESYYDPHSGIQHGIPGLYAGKETAATLKLAALSGARASVSVAARTGFGTTREVFATLPGLTKERVIIVCHTDGNTWVQDNGVSATLALASYFSQQPLSTRNKTLQFAFTSGHLAYTHDGSNALAQRLDQDYDTANGTTALVFPIEHMGTREILPKGSPSGAANGQDLEITGKGELMVWCVGPIEPLVAAIQAAVEHRQLDRVLVTRGASLPDFNKVPNYGSFGGIGTPYNEALLLTTSLISGPWSLWAPSFGSLAIDFERLRSQALAVADVIASVDGLSRQELAGDYSKFWQQCSNGTPVNTS